MSSEFTPSQPDPLVLKPAEVLRLGALCSDYDQFVQKVKRGKGSDVCVFLELNQVNGGDEPGTDMTIDGRVLNSLYRTQSEKARVIIANNSTRAFRDFLQSYDEMLRYNRLSVLPIRCIFSGHRASCIKEGSAVSYLTDEFIVMLVPPNEVAVPYIRRWFDTSCSSGYHAGPSSTDVTAGSSSEQHATTSSTGATAGSSSESSVSSTPAGPTMSQAWFETPQQRVQPQRAAAAKTTTTAAKGKSVAKAAAATPHITPLENTKVGKAYRIIAVVIGIAEPRATTSGTGGYSQQLSVADTTSWIKTQVFGSRTHNLLSGPDAGGVEAGDIMLIDALTVQSWQAGKNNERQGLIQTDKCKWAILKPGKQSTTTGANRLKASSTELAAMISLSEWYHAQGGRVELAKRFPNAKIRPLKQVQEITSDQGFYDVLAEVIHLYIPEDGNPNKPIDMYLCDYTAHPEVRAAYDRFIGYHEDEWIQRTNDGPGGGLVLRISLWDLQKQAVTRVSVGQYVIVTGVKTKWDKEYGISGSVGGKGDVNIKVRPVVDHPALNALLDRKKVWLEEREAVLAERRRLEKETEDMWESAHGGDLNRRGEVDGRETKQELQSGKEEGGGAVTGADAAAATTTDAADDSSDLSSVLTDLPEDEQQERESVEEVVHEVLVGKSSSGGALDTESHPPTEVEEDTEGSRAGNGHDDQRTEANAIQSDKAVDGPRAEEEVGQSDNAIDVPGAEAEAVQPEAAVGSADAQEEVVPSETVAESEQDNGPAVPTKPADNHRDDGLEGHAISVHDTGISLQATADAEAHVIQVDEADERPHEDVDAIQTEVAVDGHPAVDESQTQSAPEETEDVDADAMQTEAAVEGKASQAEGIADAEKVDAVMDVEMEIETQLEQGAEATIATAGDSSTDNGDSAMNIPDSTPPIKMTVTVSTTTSAALPSSSSIMVNSSWPAPAQAAPLRPRIILSQDHMNDTPMSIAELHKLSDSHTHGHTHATLAAHLIDVSPRDVTQWIKRVRLASGEGHEYRLTLALLLCGYPADLNPGNCLPVVVGGPSGEAFMGVEHEQLQSEDGREDVLQRCRRVVEGLLGRRVEDEQGLVDALPPTQPHTWSIRVFRGKKGHVLHLVDGCRAVCGE